jgi:hypothetical protein
MPSLTPKNFCHANAATANVYTVANTAGNYSIIKVINVCNTSNANATANVHILVDGASAAANNKIISNANVIGDDVLFYNTSIVMPANSKIHVSASSNTALVFNISGVEYA